MSEEIQFLCTLCKNLEAKIFSLYIELISSQVDHSKDYHMLFKQRLWTFQSQRAAEIQKKEQDNAICKRF